MSLYIIVLDFRLDAYRSLLRLRLSGLMLLLTQRRKPPEERALMLCDEMETSGGWRRC
jgi:type IV secretory pathway TraG/TraD family ATPase VirD4